LQTSHFLIRFILIAFGDVHFAFRRKMHQSSSSSKMLISEKMPLHFFIFRLVVLI